MKPWRIQYVCVLSSDDAPEFYSNVGGLSTRKSSKKRLPKGSAQPNSSGHYQHLEELPRTQENRKIRLKPLPPGN